MSPKAEVSDETTNEDVVNEETAETVVHHSGYGFWRCFFFIPHLVIGLAQFLLYLFVIAMLVAVVQDVLGYAPWTVKAFNMGVLKFIFGVGGLYLMFVGLVGPLAILLVYGVLWCVLTIFAKACGIASYNEAERDHRAFRRKMKKAAEDDDDD